MTPADPSSVPVQEGQPMTEPTTAPVSVPTDDLLRDDLIRTRDKLTSACRVLGRVTAALGGLVSDGGPAGPGYLAELAAQEWAKLRAELATACEERDKARAQVRILALYAEGQLGYLRPSDEWMNLGEPLNDDLQDAAHELVAQGLLSEFADAAEPGTHAHTAAPLPEEAQN